MWEVLVGTVVHPIRTFTALEGDRHAARHGVLALLAISAAYTAILGVFIFRGYPAAAPSVLGLPVDRQYAAQIWYQAPLFWASTALTAGALMLVALLARHRVGYSVAFGRLALATVVPFALTMMLVEATIAVLLALGALQPLAVLHWLLGPGVWCAILYQSIGLAWLGVLVVIAVRVSGINQWWLSVLAAVPLLILYGLPVGLFIR